MLLLVGATHISQNKIQSIFNIHSQIFNKPTTIHPPSHHLISRTYYSHTQPKRRSIYLSTKMTRRSGSCLRCCLVIFAVVSALCVSGPALYWRLKRGFSFKSGVSCPPCVCDCPPPLSLLKLAPGLANLSVTDCGKDDPDLKEEMEKQFVDLLSEELKLQETVGEEHMRHMNITFGEARRVASQYQKEAEKCNTATETCEQAREQAEALTRQEKKITLLWEKRARQLGWEGE
ncbi:hypothetical protein HanRHA438_Chr12g0536391 [Helianthus annuus]|nr:hypothetical protein HanHA89_Chr12g0454601 [Helianthus annuus]KAJ0865047.1 hypothetical protein HanRHA438_Chr12g0536391 [Helianthus annuus]